jgi:hypothetical protein
VADLDNRSVLQHRCRQPMARGTIFNGTLSELKYSNYDLIKNRIFNSTEASDNFIIPFQNNVFRTQIFQNIVFVFVHIHIKILNNQQRIE